jgi:hypothetical protein
MQLARVFYRDNKRKKYNHQQYSTKTDGKRSDIMILLGDIICPDHE